MTVEFADPSVKPIIGDHPPLPGSTIFPRGQIVWAFPFGSNLVNVWMGQDYKSKGDPWYVFIHGRGYGGVRVFTKTFFSELDEKIVSILLAGGEDAEVAAFDLAVAEVEKAEVSKYADQEVRAAA